MFNSFLLDKMADDFAGDIFRCIVVNTKFCILIKISLKFAHKGLFDNKTALVEIMARRQTGNTPLSQPLLTWLTDAYMRH